MADKHLLEVTIGHERLFTVCVNRERVTYSIAGDIVNAARAIPETNSLIESFLQHTFHSCQVWESETRDMFGACVDF